MTERRRLAFDLLQRYVRTGSRADGLVAADAFQELGFAKIADDVTFSAKHCRSGRRQLGERVLDEVTPGAKFLARTNAPPLSRHWRSGWAPPSRVLVAIRRLSGDGIVWERVGYQSDRGTFNCAWQKWGFYDHRRYRFEEDMLATLRLELDLADHWNESTMLVSLDKWLRGSWSSVKNDDVFAWRVLLADRMNNTPPGSRERQRAATWFAVFDDEALRRGLIR